VKRFFLFIILVTILVAGNQLTTMAQTDNAGKYGLSFHVDSPSSEVGGIYRVNDRFFINPSLSYYHTSEEFAGDERQTKKYSIETGFLYNVVLSKQMNLFVGPKIGYVLQKQTVSSSSQKLDGMSIAGVLGVQYMVSDKVGIIGSVELQHSKLSGDTGVGKLTDKATNTDQNLSVVFYF
jgi:hypothetical protein